MFAILKTNDLVLLNFSQALLRDAGIGAVVFDDCMSITDGSIGILPRRLMIADEDKDRAREVLKAGLGEDEFEP